MLPSKLSKEEKKELMLAKYVEHEELNIEDIKKFGVFWRPIDADVSTWKLVCVTDSVEEAEHQIKWRYEFHRFNNADVVIKNDKRFETFTDETKNKDSKGKTIEPTDADMVDHKNLSPSLMESLPAPATNFKSLAHYANIPLEYRGYYKIETLYEVF